MGQFTKNKTSGKPPKPYPDFPLYSHASGRWAKKVRGKTLFFGPWDDPEAALDKWLDEKDYLLAGRKPRPKSDDITIKELANRFLTVKSKRVDSGELSPTTFREYFRICKLVIGVFGENRVVEDLDASDFERLRSDLSSRLGVVALGVEITRIRTLFKFGFETSMIMML